MFRVIVSANAEASASAAAFCCSPDQSSKITPLDPRANSVHAVSLTFSAVVVAVTGTTPRSEDRTTTSPAELPRRDDPPGSTPSSCRDIGRRGQHVEPCAADRVVIDGTAAGIGISGVADTDGHEVELLRRAGTPVPATGPGAQGQQVWSSDRRSDASVARAAPDRRHTRSGPARGTSKAHRPPLPTISASIHERSQPGRDRAEARRAPARGRARR